MGVVSVEEQERRGRSMSGIGGVLFLAFLLGVPFIGNIAAFFAAFWMAGKAFQKSSNRLVDVSLALGGLIAYYFVVYLAMGNIGEHTPRMWFWASLYSLGWVWALQARARVFAD